MTKLKDLLLQSFFVRDYLSIKTSEDKKLVYICYKERVITLCKTEFGWGWWCEGSISSGVALAIERITKELR